MRETIQAVAIAITVAACMVATFALGWQLGKSLDERADRERQPVQTEARPATPEVQAALSYEYIQPATIRQLQGGSDE